MPDDDGAPPDGGGAPAAPPAGSTGETGYTGGTGVATRLAAVEAALTDLSRRFATESERAQARERVIDRQHADIERLRTVERVGTMRPVITDLCRLRNDLLRQAATLPPDVSAARVTGLLESFAVSVEEALLRCGVEVLPLEVGARFTPGRQQVARVVEIDDPDRDGTVAEVVQDGYVEIDGGRVVAAARVAVHRAAARAATPVAAPDTGAPDTGAPDTGAPDTAGTKEHVDA